LIVTTRNTANVEVFVIMVAPTAIYAAIVKFCPVGRQKEGASRPMNDRQIQGIVNAHNEALHGLREASIAFDEAAARMGAMFAAIHDANAQQCMAISAVIAANQGALRLLRR
jgi:hypothetical protein